MSECLNPGIGETEESYPEEQQHQENQEPHEGFLGSYSVLERPNSPQTVASNTEWHGSRLSGDGNQLAEVFIDNRIYNAQTRPPPPPSADQRDIHMFGPFPSGNPEVRNMAMVASISMAQVPGLLIGDTTCLEPSNQTDNGFGVLSETGCSETIQSYHCPLAQSDDNQALDPSMARMSGQILQTPFDDQSHRNDESLLPENHPLEFPSVKFTSGKASSSVQQPVHLSGLPDPLLQPQTSPELTQLGTQENLNQAPEQKAMEASVQFEVVTVDDMVGSSKETKSRAARLSSLFRGGRRGPLTSKAKRRANKVREIGACFACHVRKVKCDVQNPCSKCRDQAEHFPGLICWRPENPASLLSPKSLGSYLSDYEVAEFLSKNIRSWGLPDVQDAVEVELSSCLHGLKATIQVEAKFFVPTNEQTLEHWHLQIIDKIPSPEPSGPYEVQLSSTRSIALGMEASSGLLPEAVRIKLNDYIGAIVSERNFAEQAASYCRHSMVSHLVLQQVVDYSKEGHISGVQKALEIHAMCFVMSRHLCFTDACRETLFRKHNLVIPEWATARVLELQLKTEIDRLFRQAMGEFHAMLSQYFTSSKVSDWAPALAMTLIICMVMEELQTAADRFVCSQNEVCRLANKPKLYQRRDVLNANKEIENVAFRQIAFQFHRVFHTHRKAARHKETFNPFADSSIMDELGAAEKRLAQGLHDILTGAEKEFHYLRIRPASPEIGADDSFRYDVAHHYCGRLLSMFLLSFEDVTHIFLNDKD